MEKEKYVFDRNQFHKGFEKYCYDNDFIPYEEMLSIVDYDLKEKGIKSRYRYIIEQLDDCYKDKDQDYATSLYEYAKKEYPDDDKYFKWLKIFIEKDE